MMNTCLGTAIGCLLLLAIITAAICLIEVHVSDDGWRFSCAGIGLAVMRQDHRVKANLKWLGWYFYETERYLCIPIFPKWLRKLCARVQELYNDHLR